MFNSLPHISTFLGSLIAHTSGSTEESNPKTAPSAASKAWHIFTKVLAYPNLHGPVIAFAKKTIVSLGKEAVTSALTAKSDPLIDQLIATLRNVQQKDKWFENETDIPTIDISKLEIQNTKSLLDEFIAHTHAYLKGVKDEKGYLIQPSSDICQSFSNLSLTLGKIENQEEKEWDCEADLEKALFFLTHVQVRQMGLLQKADQVQTQLEKNLPLSGLDSFLGNLGMKRPTTPAEVEVTEEMTRAKKTVLKQITRPAEVVAPPKDFISDLIAKIDEVTDLAIKRILTQRIFPAENAFHQIYKEAQTKHEKGLFPDLDTAFYQTLEEKFNLDDKNHTFIDHFLYWFHMTITRRLLKKYGTETSERIKKDLLTFLNRSPEERVQDVFQVILKPLKSHMSAFYSYNQSLVGQILTGTIDESNQNHFKTLKIDGKSIDDILGYFVRLLIEKYAPTISWTKGIEETFMDLEAKLFGGVPSPIAQGLFSIAKTVAVWSSFLMTGVFEKLLNVGVRHFLKKEIKKSAKANFFKAGDTEEKTHNLYQHIINRFINEKLSQFNTQGASSKHHPIKLRSSLATQQEIKNVFNELARNIPLSSATNSPEALKEYFQGSFLQKGKQEFYTFFIDNFTPTIALEVLKGMEHFLYDDKTESKTIGLLSEMIWYTVNNIGKTMTAPSGEVDQLAMNTTEAEMQENLEMAVTSLVEEGIKLALDPSKKYQDETNATLRNLKKQTKAFLTSIQSLDDSNFSSKNEERRTLHRTVKEMETQFSKTKIGKITASATSILIAFEKATATLNKTMDDLEKDHNGKAALEDQVHTLKVIGEQITTSHPKDKISKLNILSKKDWISQKFKQKITIYIGYLEDFQKTPSNEHVLRLHKERSDHFKADLDTEQKRLEQLILEKVEAIENKRASIKEECEKLSAWKDSIQPLTITPRDVMSPVAESIKNLSVGEQIVPFVMPYVLELLEFKKKSYHWNGVLSRTMNAYTDLRTK